MGLDPAIGQGQLRLGGGGQATGAGVAVQTVGSVIGTPAPAALADGMTSLGVVWCWYEWYIICDDGRSWALGDPG